jgi:hypothetical protein
MGTTDILDLRYPELPGGANGPLGIQNLAEDVDSSMSVLRRSDAGYTVSGTVTGVGGTGIALATTTIPLEVIGWVDIDVDVTLSSSLLYTPSEGNANFAGEIRLYFNGAIVTNGTVRYHSLHQAVSKVRIRRLVPLPKTLAGANFTVKCDFTVDSSSTGGAVPAIVSRVVAQYGALR